MRAAKVCSYPTCPNLQPCPDHTLKPWAGSTRRKRLPRGWERLRRFILSRDPICKDGRACGGMALSKEVDHIVNNDDHRPENLQGICRQCHRNKTQAEAARARGG